MKKFILLFILLIIIPLSIFSYQYFSNQKDNLENNPNIKIDNLKPNLNEIENEYIDDNPITIGLYKYYNRNTNRELIHEYSTTWNYYNDISSFEVFFTNESFISGNYFQDTFKYYLDNYNNIDNYKIGFHISFLTNEKEFNRTILHPNDTEEFFPYLEVYLYDDYHREKGVWYSHTTEADYTDETLLTSIKLTTGKKINEIISDITVTCFSYDSNDFDANNNYLGNSKHTIIVKNPHI